MAIVETLQKPLLAVVERDLPETAADDDVDSRWTSAWTSQPGTPHEDRMPAGDDIP